VLLLQERLVCAFGESALFVQQPQDAFGRLLNQLQAHCVVSKLNVLEINAFFDVFLLFQCKHVVVEELVQLLVGKVDAELLKAIDPKVFKPKNVYSRHVSMAAYEGGG
jgi:hypothetical protein